MGGSDIGERIEIYEVKLVNWLVGWSDVVGVDGIFFDFMYRMDRVCYLRYLGN